MEIQVASHLQPIIFVFHKMKLLGPVAVLSACAKRRRYATSLVTVTGTKAIVGDS